MSRTAPGWSAVALLSAIGGALVLTALIPAGIAPPVTGLLAMAIVILAVFWRCRDRIPNILLVFVTALLGLVIAGSPVPRLSEISATERVRERWERQRGLDDRLPAVLHVVFDEMLSTGALDELGPDAGPVRESLHALGARYGLRTYDSVYSRSFFSGVSLPNLFNAEYRGKTGLGERSAQVLTDIVENEYFDAMSRRGYRTAVFQSALLNFCANASVDLCETFPSFDPSVLEPGTLEFGSRVRHVLDVLLRAWEPSYVARYGRRLLSAGAASDETAQQTGAGQRFDVQGFAAWFDRFVGFVERVPRGTHVFAHFMVPHGPYLLNADCSPGRDGGVGYYLGARYSTSSARDAARRAYYRGYLAQQGCVASRIGRFLEAIARNPQLRDAVVIVHSDHGSRISVGNLLEDYLRGDFVANYAAYFAVRAPGVERGIDCRLLSLPEAFRDAGAGPHPAPLDRAMPPVIVRSKSGRDVFVEAAMPPFGCALAGRDGKRP